MKSVHVRIRSFSGSYFPAFGVNTEGYSVSFCIQSKYCLQIRRYSPQKILMLIYFPKTGKASSVIKCYRFSDKLQRNCKINPQLNLLKVKYSNCENCEFQNDLAKIKFISLLRLVRLTFYHYAKRTF